MSPDLGITGLTEIVDFTSFYDIPNPMTLWCDKRRESVSWLRPAPCRHRKDSRLNKISSLIAVDGVLAAKPIVWSCDNLLS